MAEVSRKELKTFNFGAFIFNCGWAFNNGLNFYGYLILLLFTTTSFLILASDPWGTHDTFSTAFCCLIIISVISIYLGLKGNRLVWKSGRYSDISELKASQKFGEQFSAMGCSILVYLMLFGSIFEYISTANRTGPFNHYSARYNNCKSYLSMVNRGLGGYLSDENSLNKVDKHADILCDYIIPGHDDAASCKGLVKKQTDTACVPDTFNFRIIDKNKYEITARSNDDRYKCEICATGTGVYPDKYRDCEINSKATCRH